MSWPLVKLKSCCQVVGGATPRRNVEEYWNSPDIPWVTPKDVSNLNSSVLEDAPEYISNKGYESCTTIMLPKGSVLVTSRAPIGNIAVAGRDMCTNQGFKSLIPGKDVNGLYLYYCMLAYSERLQALGNGATFKEVSKKIVEEFEIPLPPLPEQKRIAAILDKADAIRRKRQAAIKLADDFLRATFLDIFGDPVTNPKGWEVKELRELVKLNGGYAFKSTEYVQEGIPLVRIGNANKGEFDFNNIAFLPESFRGRYEKFILRPGDLVITLTGTVGKEDYGNTVIIPNNYDVWLLNQRVAKISIVDPRLISGYFSFFLKHSSVKNNIIKNSRGIRQANLNNEDILSQTIQLPPKDKQKIFDRIIAMAEGNVRRMRHFQSSSAQAFSALSQSAFRGEL